MVWPVDQPAPDRHRGGPVSTKVAKQERRAELLRAARDVFADKGYHDAKVDDIALAARVAKGTYYLYFKDKRAVLEELVDGLLARLGAAILRVDVASDVVAQIKHNIRAILNVFLEDPALTKILLSYAAGLDPAFVAKIGSFYEGVRQLLRLSLIEGQRLGIVAAGDADAYATFTLGALKEALFEVAAEKRLRPREELVQTMFDFLEAGYLRIPITPSLTKSARRTGSRSRSAK
jgi:AcrR family transcriptional regulator